MKSKETEKKLVKHNDIGELRSFKQLSKINLNFDSPRLKKAMEHLGVNKEELEIQDRNTFCLPGLHEDVVEIRYKHFQRRLIDTINKVIEHRRGIKAEMGRDINRNYTRESSKEMLRSK